MLAFGVSFFIFVCVIPEILCLSPRSGPRFGSPRQVLHRFHSLSEMERLSTGQSRRNSRRATTAAPASFFFNNNITGASGTTTFINAQTNNTATGCTGTSTAQFADSSWYGTAAKLTIAKVFFACSGVVRQLHWHNLGDEWAHVTKGTFTLAMPSATYLPCETDTQREDNQLPPWDLDYTRTTVGDAWYFPRNWWHAFVCEDDNGCEIILWFNSPPAAAAGLSTIGLNSIFAGMPDMFAAWSLGDTQLGDISASTYSSTYKSQVAATTTAPFNSFFTTTQECNSGCVFPNPETKPSGGSYSTQSGDNGIVRNFRSHGLYRRFVRIPGGNCSVSSSSTDPGLEAWDITANSGMPFLLRTSQAGQGGSAGAGMSGQWLEFQPGGSRPPVWSTNSDIIFYVTSGNIRVYILTGPVDLYQVDERLGGYSGDPGVGPGPGTSNLGTRTLYYDLSVDETITIPEGAVYYFLETACARATAHLVWSHPERAEVELRESLGSIPFAITSSNLGLNTFTANPSSRTDTNPWGCTGSSSNKGLLGLLGLLGLIPLTLLIIGAAALVVYCVKRRKSLPGGIDDPYAGYTGSILPVPQIPQMQSVPGFPF